MDDLIKEEEVEGVRSAEEPSFMQLFKSFNWKEIVNIIVLNKYWMRVNVVG